MISYILEVVSSSCNARTQLNEMSQGWIALHDTNQLDVRLYSHAVRIFEEQADLPMYLRTTESMGWEQ